MKRLPFLLLIGCLVGFGCNSGGPALVPVSGKVTVNGKGYPNAYVNFQPMASKGAEAPGRGSMAITDGEGRFSLNYEGGQSGAVVGKHTVRITTMQEEDDPNRYAKYADTGSPDGEEILVKGKKLRAEIIPPEWNSESTKTFDVPAGGTDQANFDIQGKKSGKR